MESEDFETTEFCEDCDWHQQQIERLLALVRKTESEDFQRVLEGTVEPWPPGDAKRLLDAAVQAQLQHQRSHQTEL